MGLDMYLTAHKYVRSYDASGLSIPGEGFDKQAPAHIAQVERYNNVLRAAGLDSLQATTDPMVFEGLTVAVRVGYWRKANQIFGWFDREIAGGQTENCKEYQVPIEDLRELKHACQRVLADHSLAEQELPSESGFFFGSTEYDDYYFADLEDTVKIIERVESSPELADAEFRYHAWW